MFGILPMHTFCRVKKLAMKTESVGKKNKLKGDKLLDFIANSIGRPNMDFRSIRKLLER